MKQALLSSIAAIAVAGCAVMAQDSGGMRAGSANDMKVAFDVTSGNPVVVVKTLEIIDLTRRQLIESGLTPKIVVGFRNDASYYTQTNLSMIKEADRADALKIAAKIRELRKASGVESIEQCNVPLADRKLKPADVMQEVTLVPNGWIALATYQQKGYAYIAP